MIKINLSVIKHSYLVKRHLGCNYVYQKYYSIYQETPGFEIISLIAMIGLAILILKWKKRR